MLLGLVLLGLGGNVFANVIWGTGLLPRWVGIVFAAGVMLWLPLLPQGVRIADGMLIGVGGAGRAWAMCHRTRDWQPAPQVTELS